MSTTPGEDWTRLLLRAQAVKSLYISPPSFSVLHEVVLHRDGPRAELRLELGRFADTAPKRWDPSFNRVQVVLRFDDLLEIDIRQWGWHGTLSEGSIERLGNGIGFRFVGLDVSVIGSSLTVDAVRIEGYTVT